MSISDNFGYNRLNTSAAIYGKISIILVTDKLVQSGESCSIQQEENGRQDLHISVFYYLSDGDYFQAYLFDEIPESYNSTQHQN